ncbi:hypothetical protein GJAV_G00040380 [Gymnothorax javanicus]|nr:hypothetical protein GJAV_G00040380 [Gymnothorax javanicus]
MFPTVSCHLEINIDRAIYGQGRFRSFTFKEMWEWYSLHKRLHAESLAGSDHERRMALEANTSVKQWLAMKEDDISTKSLKCFRKYILDKETPCQDMAPPATVATATASKAPPAAPVRLRPLPRPVLQRPPLSPPPPAHQGPVGQMMLCWWKLLPPLKVKIQLEGWHKMWE